MNRRAFLQNSAISLFALSLSRYFYASACTQLEKEVLKDVCEIPEPVAEACVDGLYDSYSIVISREQKMLYVFLNGCKFKQYPVAVGRDETPTRTGVFKIMSVKSNPEWYFGALSGHENDSEIVKKLAAKYKDGKVPGSNPDNPLLYYWISLEYLSNQGTPIPSGIHGTRNEPSVGTAASHGCIRMKKADIEELVSYITPGIKKNATALPEYLIILRIE